MRLIQTLERIADALQAQAMPDRLWSIEDIAQYTGHHYNFIASLKDKKDFPRPVLLGKQPRWIPQEVKDWVKKQR